MPTEDVLDLELKILELLKDKAVVSLSETWSFS